MRLTAAFHVKNTQNNCFPPNYKVFHNSFTLKPFLKKFFGLKPKPSLAFKALKCVEKLKQSLLPIQSGKKCYFVSNLMSLLAIN